MSSGPSVGGSAQNAGLEAVERVLPVVRRVVGARVSDPHLAEDLVQETLLRIMTAWDRIEASMVEPYAIATARNVVATMWRDRDRESRNRHRALDLSTPDVPEDQVVLEEEQAAIWDALGRLDEQERERLLAHEVAGQDTRSMAAEAGSSAGAVAAQLHRTRARLRVEYLLTLEAGPPPTDDCRPVLLALSGGNRRRQRDLGVGRHLLGCDFCARVGQPLLGRAEAREDEVLVPVAADADIVKARQAAREVAAKVGFGKTQTTLIATAVSEVTRNIVRFADRGEVVIEALSEPRAGVRVVARDAGPGIANPQEALADGFSTYNGLGLGLPGARRLMDEFALASVPGHGTTVTMTKWLEED
jgi:serine/threonine-protein kinase RsbT